jgi:hypothetical protein
MARKLVLELSEADAQRLHAEAARLGVSDEDLARAVVTDVLAHQDDDFARALDRVLKKNAELYKRLS